MTLTLDAVDGIGEIQPGDDLAALVVEHTTLADDDVVVITSKIVSKAAGLSADDKERLVEEQTDRVVATRGGTRIIRTHHGLTLAAAGVDGSNVESGTYLPLPPDPDASARSIRADLRRLSGKRVAVIISDTAGRAWRNGQTDIAIGCAGLLPLEPFAGREDTHGNPLVRHCACRGGRGRGGGGAGVRQARRAPGRDRARPARRGWSPRTTVQVPRAWSDPRARTCSVSGLARPCSRPSPAVNPFHAGFLTRTRTRRTSLELAAVPDGVTVTIDGTSFRSPWRESLVAAGELRQRLLILARAHGLELSVEVTPAP